MKEQISALWDGELDENHTSAPLDALKQSAELRATWQAYGIIGDTLRGEPVLSSGFQDAFMQRLEAEPTVLAPAAQGEARRRSRGMERYLPLAASLAGVGLVAWMGLHFSPTTGTAQVAAVQPAVKAVAATAATSDADRAYLMAHQAYASGQATPGVAYYIRTVSARSGEASR